MNFAVYDNVYTYNKRQPFNGVENTRLICDSIDIHENHSFWFHTNMKMENNNVNINTRYVHIHEGIGTTNTPKFTKKPFQVGRTDIKYNPKTRMIEIGGGLFRKPVFAKKCLYYGTELPKGKMNVIGEWYYNFSVDTMIFILDFNPQKLTFHWEDIDDDLPDFEQLMRVEELESQIVDMELRVKAQTKFKSSVTNRPDMSKLTG